MIRVTLRYIWKPKAPKINVIPVVSQPELTILEFPKSLIAPPKRKDPPTEIAPKQAKKALSRTQKIAVKMEKYLESKAGTKLTVELYRRWKCDFTCNNTGKFCWTLRGLTGDYHWLNNSHVER